MPYDSLKSSDAEIIGQVIEGNVNAFETLMTRYQDIVLKIVKKRVPFSNLEETAQDVFIRVYQSLPTFKGKCNFSQWVSSIAVKTCYDYWRKTYKSQEVSMSSLSEQHQNWLGEAVADSSESPLDEKVSQKEGMELLKWALGQMSPEDRMVLELVYLEGLSGKEAANILGWSLANVKIRSLRSRRKLEKLLSGFMKKGEAR
ncbi:MAG: RNA polymerase sigma factor [Syntrophaceae bacterium]|nr:RNA polymerase sigma factor [Syntrophaceae bacterium]